jgi:hypothetical protein
MLAKVQIQAFDKRGINLPTPLGQDRLDGLCRSKDDAVFHSNDTSPPVGFDDLGIEQPKPRWVPAVETPLLAHIMRIRACA